jgi:hypothetical protein
VTSATSYSIKERIGGALGAFSITTQTTNKCQINKNGVNVPRHSATDSARVISSYSKGFNTESKEKQDSEQRNSAVGQVCHIVDCALHVRRD